MGFKICQPVRLFVCVFISQKFSAKITILVISGREEKAAKHKEIKN